MELIVKIPDEAYELLKSKPALDNIAESIIANGTPLPKGHGRLIDVNDLLVSLEKDTRAAFTRHQVWLMFSVYNKDVPTVVEAGLAQGKQDRPQGEWKLDSVGVYCNRCNMHPDYSSAFCPNCGANMRKGGAE